MSRTRPASADPAASLDRFALYELCAQAPQRDARMLRAMHGGTGRHEPLVLGEDFGGTAALSAAWAELSPRHHAVAVDHDAATLARAHRHPRVKLVKADVRKVRDPADIVAVLNFSIGELHDRDALVAYFRHVRGRLRPRGCLVLDMYGGTDAFATGQVHQSVKAPGGARIRYTWEQRTGDPLSGFVACAMHFEVRGSAARGRTRRFNDAFVYHWRLWSVPEFRDALRDAGFRTVEVYPRQPDAVDADGDYHILPVTDGNELGDAFSVYVVGRR
jgi:hypothetical protein